MANSVKRSPDLILHNGAIYTMDRHRAWAQAAAIRDGRFIAVGANPDVRALAGRGTRQMDLEGKMAIPGKTTFAPTLDLKGHGRARQVCGEGEQAGLQRGRLASARWQAVKRGFPRSTAELG